MSRFNAFSAPKSYAVATPPPKPPPQPAPPPPPEPAKKPQNQTPTRSAPKPSAAAQVTPARPLLATLRLMPPELMAKALPPLPGVEPSGYHAALDAWLVANPKDRSRTINEAWLNLVLETNARLNSASKAAESAATASPAATASTSPPAKEHWLVTRARLRAAGAAAKQPEPPPAVPPPAPPAVVDPPPAKPEPRTGPRPIFVSDSARTLVLSTFIEACLRRHAAGDFGDEPDAAANAVAEGGRTIGRYSAPQSGIPFAEPVRLVLVVVGDPDRVTALLDHEFDSAT